MIANECPCVQAEKPVAPCGPDCFHFGRGRCEHCHQSDSSRRLVRTVASIVAILQPLTPEERAEVVAETLARIKAEEHS
jgi:hypothetical protein